MAELQSVGGPINLVANSINNAEVWQVWADNTTVGTSFEAITNGNATQVHPVIAGEDIDVVSADANDTLAGTGAQKVTVKYLTSTFTVATQEVDMAGTTPVELTDQNITFILEAWISQTGTGLASAGAITIADVTGGGVHGIIDAGATRMGNCLKMVPVDSVGYCYGFWIDTDAVAAGAGTVEYALQIAEFGTSGVANSETWQTIAKVTKVEGDSDVVQATGGNVSDSGVFSFPGNVPIKIPAKAMIRLAAKAGTGTVAVTGGFQLVVVGTNAGTVTTNS